MVFYQSYPTVARGTTDATGKYVVNIFDNGSIKPIDTSSSYLMAVERGADNWGSRPKTVSLEEKGWITVNLSLEAGQGPGASTEAADDGMINGTQIVRLGGTPTSGLRITWNYNGATSAEVWGHIGAGVNFTSETSGYVSLTTTAGTQFDLLTSDIDIADGKYGYFRVVPQSIGGVANIFGTGPGGQAYNKRTVGKVDAYLGLSYSAITNPFNINYIDIPGVVGAQLQEGDQIHWWDQPTQAYKMATKQGTNWTQVHNFEFGDGMFVYITPTHSPVNLTLVGTVGNFNPSITKSLGTQYNLVGYPYPISRTAPQVGLAGREGDQVHRWTNSGQAFTMSTNVGGTWNNLSIASFEAGSGKFYYCPTSVGAYNWNFIF